MLRRLLIVAIERMLGGRQVEQMYDEILDRSKRDEQIWEEAMRVLSLDLRYDEAALLRVPRDQPLVFIANHPFGVLDGMVICYLVSRVRPRFRVLTNQALCVSERVAEYLLPIDFNDSKGAVRANIETKKRALKSLADGEALVVFPSGGVATSKNLFGPAVDLEWKTFAAKMIRRSMASVVPIYFHGSNSRFFQIASHMSQTLRMAILLGEFKRRVGSEVHVTIGAPIPWTELESIKCRRALTQHLWQATHLLRDQASQGNRLLSREA